jgi:hypothetical protein
MLNKNKMKKKKIKKQKEKHIKHNHIDIWKNIIMQCIEKSGNFSYLWDR